MKYLKLFFIALVVTLVATSCEDNGTKWNTNGDVTVEMSESTLFTKEGRKIAKVPFKVVGEANGYISVDFNVVEVAVDTTEEAFENIHYYPTTKTIKLDPEFKEGYFEFTIVNDRVINDARSFIVSIASAEGANVGTNSQSLVVIRDNDKDPYDRLGGIWKMTFVDGDEVVNEVRVEIEPYLEEEAQYHMVLPVKGDFPFGEATLYFRYLMNDNGQGVGVGLAGGGILAENLNFGSEIGTANILTGVESQGALSTKGYIEGEWNEDFTEISFGTKVLYLVVRTTQDNTGQLGPNAIVGAYDTWTDIKLTFLEDIE